MALDELRKFNVDTIGLDEAVALSAIAKAVRAEFDVRNIEPPVWFDTKQRELGRFIEMAKQDQTDKRISEIRAKLSTLEDSATKRDRLERELAALTGASATVVAK